jgi:hypothetical protein
MPMNISTAMTARGWDWSKKLSHCDKHKLIVSRKSCLPLENFVSNQEAAQEECLDIGGLNKLAGDKKVGRP